MMLPGISRLLLLISLSERVIQGFQNGAPPSICKSTAPNHGSWTSQSTPSPYTISARVINSDDGVVQVKIQSNLTFRYFTGFLLKVKNTSPLNGLQLTSGVFTSERDDVSVLLCDGDKMPAVTHSNSKRKDTVQIKWQAEAGYSGDVIFVATVLYNYTTFWTNVESLPINVSRKAALVKSVIEPELSLNATVQKTYDGCGVTKNCLYSPEDCLATQTCNSLLTILPSFGVYQLEMFAKKSKFVGVGFSTDEVMGSDMNAECVYDGPTVKSYRSWNFPRRKVNVRLPYDNGVTLIRGIYDDRTIYCKIKVDAIMEAHNETVDLNNNKYYVVLVSGQELSESKPGIGYHDLNRVMSKGRHFLPVISDPADEFFYDACDRNALCHGLPEGCLQYKNCRFVTKVNVQDRLFVVSMLAHRTLYVATGFTEDQRRGNDHIVECINNGSMLQTYRSWNVPHSFDNYRMGTTGLELFNGSVTSDVLICTVMFDPSVIPSFKLDQPYYLILVSGSSLRQTQIGYHNLARSFSNATISLYRNDEANHVFYIGCGQTRRCFGSPDGCVSKMSCDVVVSIAPDNVGNRYSFHMKSIKSPAYIAVGLSDDKIMGNDAVIECVREENSVKTYMSWNLAGMKNNQRIEPNPMTHLYGSFIDGKLECIVIFQKSVFTFQNKSLDFTKDNYVLMLAMGNSSFASSNGSKGGINYHNMLYTVSNEAQTLHVIRVLEEPSKILLNLHAAIMIFSWVGLSGIGLIVARFYKSDGTNEAVLYRKSFPWCKYYMISASVLTIISFGFIYIHCDGLSRIWSSYHPLVGFVTTVLAFIQTILNVNRLSYSLRYSTITILLNRLNWFIENLLYVMAVITIYFAINFENLILSRWINLILTSYVIYYVIINLILMVVRDVKREKSSQNMNMIHEIGSNKGILSKKWLKFEKGVFIFNLAIAMIFVIILTYIIIN